MVLAGTLLTSCVTRYVKTDPPPCYVPKWPDDPVLELREDGELTDESLVNLGLYIRGGIRYYEATTRCPGVVVRELESEP